MISFADTIQFNDAFHCTQMIYNIIFPTHPQYTFVDGIIAVHSAIHIRIYRRYLSANAIIVHLFAYFCKHIPLTPEII